MIGASADKPSANEKWAQKYGLRMPLIGNPSGDNEVVGAFGVARATGAATRTTFLIEPDGTLAKVYPKVKAKGHAAQVLADVGELWG